MKNLTGKLCYRKDDRAMPWDVKSWAQLTARLSH